ncbi:STAS domain-containing protein [Nonomuraea rhodomycinica]|uniref:Anti-sigma factor antagonist n=1 Tax=Nonomuraea rhodomycinica TaxID=1712872 RepID=A0A7Y6II48_9ACTN|nr:STAS domain-containing protein [Nonomuraea rhodomycinica]NUW38668.1 STAS domain-containing protein [Nonomuraea rhodomycinica]
MTVLAPAPSGGADVLTVATVHLTGEIDVFTSHALRRRLMRALPAGAGLLIVDLSAVSFCDASGLAVLVGIQRRARPRGVALTLKAPRPLMTTLLRVTGLDRVLTVVP